MIIGGNLRCPSDAPRRPLFLPEAAVAIAGLADARVGSNPCRRLLFYRA